MVGPVDLAQRGVGGGVGVMYLYVMVCGRTASSNPAFMWSILGTVGYCETVV